MRRSLSMLAVVVVSTMLAGGCTASPDQTPTALPSSATTDTGGPEGLTSDLNPDETDSVKRFEGLRSAEAAGKAQSAAGKAATKAAPKDPASGAAKQQGKASAQKPRKSRVNYGAAPLTMSLTTAKGRYKDIDRAFALASADLVRAMDDASTDTATLRAAVRVAAAGYDARLDALRRNDWPRAVQPYVDSYLALAHSTGRKLFKHAQRAKTLAEMQNPEDTQAAFQLSHAESLVRAKLKLAG